VIGRGIAGMREMRNMFKIFVGESKGKRQSGRSGRRWENNITMDLK
jgi:hypothetical protein